MAARRRRAPDPPAQLAELAKSLDGEELARGYVLRGEERYFHERAIDLVCARAAALGHEVCRHDVAPPSNPDFRLSTLIDDLSGGGLFAARRNSMARATARTRSSGSPLIIKPPTLPHPKPIWDTSRPVLPRTL